MKKNISEGIFLEDIDEKYENLLNLLKNLNSVLVAFSGGVDSSVVAYAAHKILGKRALAVTIDNFVMPRKEIIYAKMTAKEIGINHIVISEEISEENKENKDQNLENFLKNPINRCYFCKKHVIKILKNIAKEHEIEAIVDGTNADDLKDPKRYGLKALREENVISPLAEAGLTKHEIRKIAKKIGLTNAQKPSMSCLATRIMHNEPLTKKRIERVEKAENFIDDILSKTNNTGKYKIRVRDYKNTARVECNAECMELIVKNKKNKDKIISELKKLGYEDVLFLRQNW